MQIETNHEGNRPTQDTTREILAILAESGLLPGQGVEAMLDRLAGEGRPR